MLNSISIFICKLNRSTFTILTCLVLIKISLLKHKCLLIRLKELTNVWIVAADVADVIVNIWILIFKFLYPIFVLLLPSLGYRLVSTPLMRILWNINFKKWRYLWFITWYVSRVWHYICASIHPPVCLLPQV